MRYEFFDCNYLKKKKLTSKIITKDHQTVQHFLGQVVVAVAVVVDGFVVVGTVGKGVGGNVVVVVWVDGAEHRWEKHDL